MRLKDEEIKRSHFETEKSQKKHPDLFDCTRDGYLIFNKQDTLSVSEVNPVAIELLGLEGKSVNDNSFRYYVKSEFHDKFYIHRYGALRPSAKQACPDREFLWAPVNQHICNHMRNVEALEMQCRALNLKLLKGNIWHCEFPEKEQYYGADW